MEKKKLFDNFKFLVVESADLGSEEVHQLTGILDEYQVPYDVIKSDITEEELIYKEYTHVIANSADFNVYTFTQENMIPVVVSRFIFKAVELQKQPPIRPFSPDPRYVLKDIHICVGDLPLSDKEAIHGGVRALGGTFSETLNKFVTHLISVDPDEDCCIAVNSIEGCEIKIVLPEWIDDCLKFRRRLEELPYLQNVLENIDSSNGNKERELGIIDKDSQLIASKTEFLEGKIFYIGEDLELTERSLGLISNLISSSGGAMATNLKEASCYLGRYREGDEYSLASKKMIHVGNLNWIFWMVEHQRWISPFERLLHYPYVRGGLPGMENFIIASTNYSGDARFYIMKLVEALGAQFTTSLKPKNTHLIAAKPVGNKYKAAKQWKNISIINHLWLEESYARYQIESVDHPRYSHYPRAINMKDIVGGTKLNLEILKQFFEDESGLEIPNNVIEDSEGDETNNSFIAQLREATSQHKGEPLTPKNSSDINITLPIDHSTGTPSKEETAHNEDLKLNTKILTSGTIQGETETPASKLVNLSIMRQSTGRKAKAKAVEKLHSDMEDLNLFQKQHKSKSIPMLPTEVEEKKRKRTDDERVLKERESGRVEVAKTDSDNHTKKKTKNSVLTHYSINAITTGWEVEFSKSELSTLNKLGISLRKEFDDNVNAIISPKFMRTEKFLKGLSHHLDYILSPTFLKTVLKVSAADAKEQDELPDVKDYSLDKVDSESVRQLTSLSVKSLLDISNKKISLNQRIFKDLTFNISPKVPGGPSVVQSILIAHGADKVHLLKTLKEFKSVKSLKASKDKSVVLVSNEKGYIDKFKKLLKDDDTVTHGKVIEWNWVVNSIFNMEIDDSKYVIYNH